MRHWDSVSNSSLQTGNIRGEADDNETDTETFLNTLTEPEREELEAMVQSDYIYSRLISSIAPTVYGHEIVKKGILLQLFGGTNKSIARGGGGGGPRYRGDINVLLVGDPGVSKSQILGVSRFIVYDWLGWLTGGFSTSTRSLLEGCTLPAKVLLLWVSPHMSHAIPTPSS